MDHESTIDVGTCTFGPVVLSASTTHENKFSITVIKYDGSKHYNLINCKTTSNTAKVWPGEFIVDDLFGYGTSKIQPYNIVRILKSNIPSHRHVGILDISLLPQFEHGLKIAIKQGMFDAKETLDLADSWQHLFNFPSD